MVEQYRPPLKVRKLYVMLDVFSSTLYVYLHARNSNMDKSTQKYNYDMQDPATPTDSAAEVVSNTAKIPHEPLGILIFKWIIILIGSSMLGMILVLFGQIIYHNITVAGGRHFREKCPVPNYVDFAYAVHVEKVEGINGTKEFVQEDVFNKLVLQINESWMNLSKEDSIAMMIFKKCLVNGRAVFYCKDTKVLMFPAFK